MNQAWVDLGKLPQPQRDFTLSAITHMNIAAEAVESLEQLRHVHDAADREYLKASKRDPWFGNRLVDCEDDVWRVWRLNHGR